MKVTVIQHIVTVLVGLKQIQHLVEYRWDEREIFLGDLLHFSAPSLNGLCEGREFLDEEPSHWSHSLRHESICVLVVADGLIVVREEGQGVEFRDLLKHLRRGSEVQRLIAHRKLWTEVVDEDDFMGLQTGEAQPKGINLNNK